MMLSGVEWRECKACPKRFLVLVESERPECLECERKRKGAERRANESRAWHAEKEGEAGRKGGRPKKYQTDSERHRAERRQNAVRQRAFRERVQRNGKPPRMFTETRDLQAQKSTRSHDPLSPGLPALGMPRSAKAGDSRT
jgi:hypothetical protein